MTHLSKRGVLKGLNHFVSFMIKILTNMGSTSHSAGSTLNILNAAKMMTMHC